MRVAIIVGMCNLGMQLNKRNGQGAVVPCCSAADNSRSVVGSVYSVLSGNELRASNSVAEWTAYNRLGAGSTPAWPTSI
jgi:hypothetical protein